MATSFFQLPHSVRSAHLTLRFSPRCIPFVPPDLSRAANPLHSTMAALIERRKSSLQIYTVTPKGTTSKKATIRHRIKRRITQAAKEVLAARLGKLSPQGAPKDLDKEKGTMAFFPSGLEVVTMDWKDLKKEMEVCMAKFLEIRGKEERGTLQPVRSRSGKIKGDWKMPTVLGVRGQQPQGGGGGNTARGGAGGAGGNAGRGGQTGSGSNIVRGGGGQGRDQQRQQQQQQQQRAVGGDQRRAGGGGGSDRGGQKRDQGRGGQQQKTQGGNRGASAQRSAGGGGSGGGQDRRGSAQQQQAGGGQNRQSGGQNARGDRAKQDGGSSRRSGRSGGGNENR